MSGRVISIPEVAAGASAEAVENAGNAGQISMYDSLPDTASAVVPAQL